MSNDDLFKYNYHNGDNTYNRDKNSFNFSPVVDDDYEQINNNNKALQEGILFYCTTMLLFALK